MVHTAARHVNNNPGAQNSSEYCNPCPTAHPSATFQKEKSDKHRLQIVRLDAEARCGAPSAQRQRRRQTDLCLKRAGSDRVAEEKRRKTFTCLIEQCVNGLAGCARWGPADGFPHPVVVCAALRCTAVPPSPPQLATQRGPPAPFSSPPLTPLACKWRLSPFACAADRLRRTISFSVHYYNSPHCCGIIGGWMVVCGEVRLTWFFWCEYQRLLRHTDSHHD